ncbi:hypothetical protein GALL_529780 [mine drainage metagenome]|uniref:Uncharacterized protein n=1 Tax=mine drainage metagenome TaxID=410659 RepID=A0A1J5PCB3_9ZZZZ
MRLQGIAVIASSKQADRGPEIHHPGVMRLPVGHMRLKHRTEIWIKPGMCIKPTHQAIEGALVKPRLCAELFGQSTAAILRRNLGWRCVQHLPEQALLAFWHCDSTRGRMRHDNPICGLLNSTIASHNKTGKPRIETDPVH